MTGLREEYDPSMLVWFLIICWIMVVCIVGQMCRVQVCLNDQVLVVVMIMQ